MNNKTDDKAIVERVQLGEKAAFNTLVLKYQEKLRGPVSKLIKIERDVDDVVQDTFIKAYIALPTFRNESAFYTWLYRIAINTAKNMLKARKSRPPAVGTPIEEAEHTFELMKDYGGPQSLLVQKETAAIIQEALANMSGLLREALTLREFNNLSYGEIAKIQGCPIGTIKNRLFRARESIKKALKV